MFGPRPGTSPPRHGIAASAVDPVTGKRRMDRAAGQSVKLNKRYLQNPYQADHTALPGCVPAEPGPGIGHARGRFRDRNSGASGRSQGAHCFNKSQKKAAIQNRTFFGPHPGTSPPRHRIAAPAVDPVTGKRCMDRVAVQNVKLNKQYLQNLYQAGNTALPGCVPAEPGPGIGRARGRFRDRNSGAMGHSQGAHCFNKSKKKATTQNRAVPPPGLNSSTNSVRFQVPV